MARGDRGAAARDIAVALRSKNWPGLASISRPITVISVQCAGCCHYRVPDHSAVSATTPSAGGRHPLLSFSAGIKKAPASWGRWPAGRGVSRSTFRSHRMLRPGGTLHKYDRAGVHFRAHWSAAERPLSRGRWKSDGPAATRVCGAVATFCRDQVFGRLYQDGTGRIE